MKNGADVARESAHVVFMEDNLWRLISALEISQNAIGLIRQNYAITAGLNAVALALSIPRGLMALEFTALISNGSASSRPSTCSGQSWVLGSKFLRLVPAPIPISYIYQSGLRQ